LKISLLVTTNKSLVKIALLYLFKIQTDMFESLKQIAMQQLMAKMASNSLGETQTQEAATEGANGIMEMLQSKIAGGNLAEVKDLFSGGNWENNAAFAEAKAKMSETLQAKGMSAEEAEAEAANTTPDLLNSLKDKFQSTDAADSAFDLEGLANMIPGGVGGLLNTAKNIFGK